MLASMKNSDFRPPKTAFVFYHINFFLSLFLGSYHLITANQNVTTDFASVKSHDCW